MSEAIYVALGDGITCGIGASRPETAYTATTLQQLQASGRVTASTVLGQTSWTVRHLLRACTAAPESLWQNAELVTLLIGGNDLRRHYYGVLNNANSDAVIHQAVKQFTVDLNHLCTYLQPLLPDSRILLTQYNPFPHSPLAVRAIGQLNAVITTVARHYGWTVVDLEAPFAGQQPRLIAGYRTGGMEDLSMPFQRPLCPNDFGHKVIADAISPHL